MLCTAAGYENKTSVIVLDKTHHTGSQFVCQAEMCKGVIGPEDDVAMEVGSGKTFHKRCSLLARKHSEKYAQLVDEYTHTSIWRTRSEREIDVAAHRHLCTDHAAQHWRCLWSAGSPYNVQVRFTPWSKPYQHGSGALFENFSVRWTERAAQHLIWPDSQSLNLSRGLTLIQHLFPVAWFTEGCAFWQLSLPSATTKACGTQVAKDLQHILDESRELAKALKCQVSCWAATNIATTTLLLRVAWRALPGSRLYYEPVHMLAEDCAWKQAPVWQLHWQQSAWQPLLDAVHRALEDLRKDRQLSTRAWRQIGQPQHRAQFTWDSESLTVWANLLPPVTNIMFVDVSQSPQSMLYLRHNKEVMELPYQITSREDLEARCVDIKSERPLCSNLMRVDQTQQK